MTEVIHLNWDQLPAKALQTFQDLRGDVDFTDVTLASGDGKLFNAHKIILASSSTFFRRVLSQYTHPHPLLYLNSVNIKEIEGLMNFIYTGEVEIENDDLKTFLEAAAILKIAGLHTAADALKKDKRFMKDDITHSEHSSSIKSEPLDHSDESLSLETSKTFDGDINQFPCTKCNKILSSRSNLKRHMLSLHSGMRYECDQCESTFSEKSNVIRHKTIAHMKEGTPSDFSNENSTTAITVKEEYETHNERIEVDKNIKPLQKRGTSPSLEIARSDLEDMNGYPCTKCFKILASPNSLKRHMESIHDGVRYNCDLCDSTFTEKNSVKKHKKTVHNKEVNSIFDLPPQNSSMNSEVNEDSIEVTVEKRGQEHDSYLSNENDIQPNLADLKVIKSSEDLNNEKIELEQSIYQHCYMCDFKSTDYEILIGHIEKYHNEKFVCEECNMEFENNDTLQDHKKYHVGTKYPCRHCDNEFSSKLKLMRHMQQIIENRKQYKTTLDNLL